jgi:hypothetical protein
MNVFHFATDALTRNGWEVKSSEKVNAYPSGYLTIDWYINSKHPSVSIKTIESPKHGQYVEIYKNHFQTSDLQTPIKTFDQLVKELKTVGVSFK